MKSLDPEVIVEGLTTKSDKIRALAQAGYSRADIARHLEIRYQHVRNVLVRSGIDAGKRDTAVSPRSSKSTSAPEPWPITRLLNAGFEKIGSCHLTAGDAFQYSDRAPTKPGVYAFAVDGAVAYIGLTRGALRTRLGHYVYGHVKQRTSARVKKLILAALTNGEEVTVYVACPPAMEWNGLPVDTAAGLETGLIRLIRPPWNQQGIT